MLAPPSMDRDWAAAVISQLDLTRSTDTQGSPGFTRRPRDGRARAHAQLWPAASQHEPVLSPVGLGTRGRRDPVVQLPQPPPGLRLQQRPSAAESRTHRGSCAPIFGGGRSLGASWGPAGAATGKG